jgi:hypothetical protein
MKAEPSLSDAFLRVLRQLGRDPVGNVRAAAELALRPGQVSLDVLRSMLDVEQLRARRDRCRAAITAFKRDRLRGSRIRASLE